MIMLLLQDAAEILHGENVTLGYATLAQSIVLLGLLSEDMLWVLVMLQMTIRLQ